MNQSVLVKRCTSTCPSILNPSTKAHWHTPTNVTNLPPTCYPPLQTFKHAIHIPTTLTQPSVHQSHLNTQNTGRVKVRYVTFSPGDGRALPLTAHFGPQIPSQSRARCCKPKIQCFVVPVCHRNLQSHRNLRQKSFVQLFCCVFVLFFNSMTLSCIENAFSNCTCCIIN